MNSKNTILSNEILLISVNVFTVLKLLNKLTYFNDIVDI